MKSAQKEEFKHFGMDWNSYFAANQFGGQS